MRFLSSLLESLSQCPPAFIHLHIISALERLVCSYVYNDPDIRQPCYMQLECNIEDCRESVLRKRQESQAARQPRPPNADANR